MYDWTNCLWWARSCQLRSVVFLLHLLFNALEVRIVSIKLNCTDHVHKFVIFVNKKEYGHVMISEFYNIGVVKSSPLIMKF
jgi:hypothetical protein